MSTKGINMSKHTTGPWELDQYGHVYGWKQVDSTTKQSVPLLDGRHSQATVHDKLLIAAAPDLLAALDAFVNPSSPVMPSEAKRIALAAIAKARGES